MNDHGRARPRFDALEARLLLSSDALLGEAVGAAQVGVEAAPLVLVTQQAVGFTRLAPAGGMMSVSRANSGTLSGAGDQSDFELFAEGGQTIAAIATPVSATVTITIELVGQTVAFSAPGPGQPAVLPAATIPADGTYTVRISCDGATDHDTDIYRNAVLEAQIGDSGDGNELAIDNSMIDLGSGRMGMVGTSTAATVDEITFNGNQNRIVDAVLDGINGADFTAAQLELLDTDGNTVLATATTHPAGGGGDLYDLAILDFVLPADGTFTLRLTSSVAADYGLIVTDEVTFEVEPNDALTDPLRSLDATGEALGFFGTLPVADPLVDGSFELGPFSGAWNEFSTNFGTPICDVATCGTGNGTGPRTGTYWAWFGGTSAQEDALVNQDVVFPTGSAYLSFYLEIPAAVGIGFDIFSVWVDNTNVFQVTDLDSFSYPNYTQVVLNVSQFANGQPHSIQIQAQNFGLFGITNFMVDDAALSSQPPSANLNTVPGESLAARGRDAVHQARRLSTQDLSPPRESGPRSPSVDTSAARHGAADLAVNNAAASPTQPHRSALTTVLPMGTTVEQLAAQLAPTEPSAAVQASAGDSGFTSLTTLGESEPNDTRATADPLPLGIGGGKDDAVDISASITGGGDLDFFSFQLVAGDIIGANVTGGAGFLSLQDASGNEIIGSGQELTFIHPAISPLPGGGNATLAAVIDTAGTYYLRVSQGSGSYTANLRVFRPALEGMAVGSRQALFLDFDGESIDTSIFGGSGVANLSSLSTFMTNWGLDPVTDLNAVIDAIIASVDENLSADIRASGFNGDFDTSSVAGDFDIEILNSRDHADLFGSANVSRIIVGGSIAEFGISTIGIAQTIDVGNFDTAESAVVLLDVLSAAATGGVSDSINDIPLAAGASIIDAIGVVVGVITAHEGGHFFANFHTENANATPNIMDRGGNGVFDEAGVGPDGIFGNSDDIDVDFGADVFTSAEGLTGTENTLNAIAFGLSTGMFDPLLNGPIVVSVTPAAGATGDLNITDIMIEFSETITIASALAASNYRLLEAGTNGTFEGGTGDDMTIAVTPSFNGATIVTLTIDAGAAPLAPGKYQLTIDGDSSIVDLDGNPLNSTTGPGGGSDEVIEFSVIFQLDPGGDLYQFTASAGESITVTTQTPLDDPLSSPLNSLNPRLVVLGPAGVPVAQDNDSLDGKNATAQFNASEAGTYIVQVLAESGDGEYLLSIDHSPTGAALPHFDNFNDSVADFFAAATGNWFVNGSLKYRGNASPEDIAISLIALADPLPVDYQIDVLLRGKAPGAKQNAYVIFDYQNPMDFKYAGAVIGSDKWRIGHFDGTNWLADALVAETIYVDTDYAVQIRIEGMIATLLLDGVEKVDFEFGDPLNDGQIGLGTNDADAAFDDFAVTEAADGATLPHTEDFNDGTADLFTADSGTWFVNSSNRYRGKAPAGGNAISLIPLAHPLPGDYQIDVLLRSRAAGTKQNAYAVFDYQNPMNFKYAGAAVGSDKWRIGHFDGTNWLADALFAETIDVDTDYAVQIRIEGMTATLLLDGVEKVSFEFGDQLNDGQIGLGANDADAVFDDFAVAETIGGAALPYTEDFTDGVADFFAPQLGMWFINEWDRYRAEAAAGSNAIALLQTIAPLPSDYQFDVTMRSKTSGVKENMYIIFDYQGPMNFKFAGAAVSVGLWRIGQSDGSNWAGDDELSEVIASNTDYNLSLQIEGTTATLLVNGVDKVSFDFGTSLNTGQVGFATHDAHAIFDDVALDALTGGSSASSLLTSAVTTDGATPGDSAAAIADLLASAAAWSSPQRPVATESSSWQPDDDYDRHGRII